MALLFMHGADFVDTQAQQDTLWDNFTGDASTPQGAGSSGRCMTGSNSTDEARIEFANTPTLIAGIRMHIGRFTGSASPIEFLSFFYDTTSQISLRYSYVFDQVSVYLGSTQEQVATKQLHINKGWVYFELKATANPFGGYEVRINGSSTPIMTGSGVNTDPAGNALFNAAVVNFSTTTVTHIMDDFYVCDGTGSNNNDFLGMKHVWTEWPGGAGSEADWMATGAATNWEAVNDTTPSGGTDYVEYSGDGGIDLYNMGTFASIDNIAGVQSNAFVSDQSSVGAGIILQMKRTSTVSGSNGSQEAGQGSYEHMWSMFESDTEGVFPWTITNLNNSETGYESTI